jgi:hypothetical protein
MLAKAPGFTAIAVLTLGVNHFPGVSSAAFTSLLPLSEKREVLTAGTYGASFEKDERGCNVFLYTVTPEYFQTMGIPLRQGRFLDRRGMAGTAQAALISESLAKREFPGEDPVGKRLHVDLGIRSEPK